MEIRKSTFGIILASTALWLGGCNKDASSQAPQFEVRDFVVTEEKHEATAYSGEWNSFEGKGTIVARNVDKDRNLVLMLEVFDETKGANAEPSIKAVLVRGGIGKIETEKSDFRKISEPPKYAWKVLGWYELQKATIEAPDSPIK